MRSPFVNAQKNYPKTDYSNGQLKEEAWLGSNQKRAIVNFKIKMEQYRKKFYLKIINPLNIGIFTEK